MPEVFDYDDETGDAEILDDIPTQRTFSDGIVDFDLSEMNRS